MADQAKIGDWWTVCCDIDLIELTTDEQVAEAQEWIDEDEPGPGKKLWPTKEAALAELKPQP